MKKIFLVLGGVLTTVAPIVAVVSCGCSQSSNEVKPTITHEQIQKALQGDATISLKNQIFPKDFIGLPDDIDTVPSFAGSTFLGKFTLENSKATKLADEAFMGVKLPENFKLPDGLETVGAKAFANAILPDDFRLPDSITNLAADAFIGTEVPLGFEIPMGVMDKLSGRTSPPSAFPLSWVFQGILKPGMIWYWEEILGVKEKAVPLNDRQVTNAIFVGLEKPKPTT